MASITLPKNLAHRRAIRSLSKKLEIYPITAAALIGYDALQAYLRYVLTKYPDAEEPFHGKLPALFAAVHRDCARSVDALIVAARANPFLILRNKIYPCNATAVHMAAVRGKLNALEAIIRLDHTRLVSIVVDDLGFAPAHVAAACAHTDVLRLLAKHDPRAIAVRVVRSFQRPRRDGNSEHDFCSFLPKTSKMIPFKSYSSREFVTITSLRSWDRCSATPMHFAADLGRTEVIQELVQLSLEEQSNLSCAIPNAYRSITDLTGQEYFTLKGRAKKPTTVSTQFTQLQHWQRLELQARRAIDVSEGEERRPLKESSCTDTGRETNGQVKSGETGSFFHEVLDGCNDIGNTPLHLAAKKRNEQIVHKLVDLGADLHAKGAGGRTVLHAAAGTGNLQLLPILVKQYKLPVDTRDFYGFTPLHIAVLYDKTGKVVEEVLALGGDCAARTYVRDNNPLTLAGELEYTQGFKPLLKSTYDLNTVCRWADLISPAHAMASFKNFDMLLEFIAYAQSKRIALDLNSPCGHGYTVLTTAIMNRAKACVVKALIDANALPDAGRTDNGRTSLGIAAEHKDPDVVRILLEAGADVNHKDNAGWSALHIAADIGTVECMKVLIEHGADLNVQNEQVACKTPLHLAASTNDFEKIRVLLSAGAERDPCCPDRKVTPFLVSANQGDVASVKEFIHAGADMYARDMHGHGALGLAVYSGSVELVKLLLEEGYPINSVESKYGAAAIHLATMIRNVNVLRLVLMRGADIGALDYGKYSALHMAAFESGVEAMEVLIEAGIDIHAKTINGEDALLIAARGGKLPCVVYLESCGAKLNSKDALGATALHHAAELGHTSMAQYCLRHGADVLAVNNNRLTPMMCAIAAGKRQIVRLLLGHSSSVLEAFAPLRVHDLHSPCVSSGTLISIEGQRRREERHEECELDSSRPVCAICRTLLRSGDDVRSLLCRHTFHDDCMVAWLGSEHGSGQLICPLCRRPLVPMQNGGQRNSPP